MPLAISMGRIELIRIPNWLLGAISCIPPTSVAIGGVPQAAASSKTVEKPSDREGRQHASDCIIKAAKSSRDSPPSKITLLGLIFSAFEKSGPLPAIAIVMLPSQPSRFF